ncbi:MAG: GGDEF domain-containing response regulator [unclassified Hahellaceae]|nr:GGDEF domain-containing response regulator [Hahellaceae bacterium]|tara:strand:- start:11962 stop:13860 length:1899 start_codon:yes stop_codon:yes gene_type:complete
MTCLVDNDRYTFYSTDLANPDYTDDWFYQLQSSALAPIRICMSHKLQLRLGISLVALILLPFVLAGYVLVNYAPPGLLQTLGEPWVWISIVVLVLTSAGLLFGLMFHQVFRPVLAVQAWINAIASDEGIRVEPRHRRTIAHLLKRGDEVGSLATATQNLERQLVETKRKLANIAYYDSLTGLANRHTFTLFLRKCLESARRHHHSAALLYIDIDGFKDVNDTLGHGAGDQILKQIAERLNTVLRAEDYIADMSVHHDPLLVDDRARNGYDAGPRISRIGGDEFAVVIKQLDEVHHAVLICERLLMAMKERFTVEGQQFTLGASIGVSMYPGDGDTDEDLLKCADIAMYHSKNSGRNTFNFYNENMEVVALEMHQLIADLQNAVENEEFYLQYQPQFSTLTGQLVSLEALVRWQHPTKGFIPPNDFISLAESSGIIVKLGRWILMEACRMLARLHKEIGPEIRIAVNVSPVQFAADHGFLEAVRDALLETGLDGACLDLEITESAIMQSGQVALETLQSMKALNVNVSMDDFGTGYSSLAALRDMPIDQLKIDKAFIDHILGGGREHSIIKAMLALAKELDIEVVAEGVETNAQLKFLKLLRCDLVQGYLMSKPLSEDNLFEFIRQHAESPVF